MQKITGTYKRESDNQSFDYSVEFTPQHWSAEVHDVNGDLAGKPSIALHGKLLDGAELENNVREWIEGAIRDRVGVR